MNDLSPAEQHLITMMLEADKLMCSVTEEELLKAFAGDLSVFPMLLPGMQDCLQRLLDYSKSERDELLEKRKLCDEKDIRCAECGMLADSWKVVWDQEEGGWRLACGCDNDIDRGSVKAHD